MNSLFKVKRLLRITTPFWVSCVVVFLLTPVTTSAQKRVVEADKGVGVGSQYDSTHVYVSPADLDALVSSLTATFGGSAPKKSSMNVLPVPSTTISQLALTPVGTFSIFAYKTPIPYPFGSERTGYLVTDMPQALKQAEASGAEIIVNQFQDPIGYDAVIQWDGGFRTQLYWHFASPSYGSLESVPDNRVYISPDRADTFVKQFVLFSHGKIVSDDAKADRGEIGSPGKTYRRIRLKSVFGKMQINVTEGFLPFPFGREVTGYEVKDLDDTLRKAKQSGATILTAPYKSTDRTSVMIEFPGGFIAEVHCVKRH